MIRAGTTLDWPQMVQIAERQRSPQFGWDGPTLLSEQAFSEVLVLCEGDQVLGFILYRNLGGELEILCLATHPDHQGKGHMKSLLTALLDASHNKGVWLEVHEAHLAAQKLYKACGFVLRGRRPRYYKDGGAALVFERPLA